MKYQFTLLLEDSPAWPIKSDAEAYKRLHAIGKEGRLGEFVTNWQRVEQRDWRSVLQPKTKKK